MSDPFHLLGLARRAGRLAAGHEAVERAVVTGRARLVLVAGDASAASRERFRRLAEAHGVDFRVCGSKEELGRAVGSAPKAVLAILDAGLAARVMAGVDRMAGDLP